MGNRASNQSQTRGVHVGGNLTATNVTSYIVNAAKSQAVSKSAFRLNIPTPTPHFKGRTKTMKDVRNYFTKLPRQAANCWDRIIAIVGFGGMGKTETAYKFAAEHKKLFPNVALINSETQQSAMTSFLELAKHLGIVPKDTQIADEDLNLVKEVYREIDRRDRGRVLLIFDNALQLNSNGTEFGILKYLPTEDLPNGRFPYIIITTQTHYWERGINKFLVDGLTDEESLDFFCSSFELKTPECNEVFKKLHEILEGYPLVMNLVAAQIDYIPNEDSVDHLKQQICKYIDKLGNNQNKILNETMSRASSNPYNKTLSNVWQLTFERIQQEEKGRDALELLQMMSFLNVPINSYDVVNMLGHSSDCPHPPKKELEFRLKELIRILERFYTLRILKVYHNNDENYYFCQWGIHRLVQFVVRHQMDSSKVLERVLFNFAIEDNYDDWECVNISALDEALDRIPLSQQALPYVGFLACQGFPPACKFVETRSPETKAATTIWRLYSLERGMKTLDEKATQVLWELIELTKFEDQLADSYFFGDITMNLLTDADYCDHTRDDGTEVPGYFDLNTFVGIEELVAQLILNSGSRQDTICKSQNCDTVWYRRDSKLAEQIVKLSETFIRADAPYSMSTVYVISDTWFALFARLKYYEHNEEYFPYFFEVFWHQIHEVFHSPNASQCRIGALKTGLWNRGLAKEFIQVFGSIRDFSNRFGILGNLGLLQMMDFCIDGMDMRDQRVQEVISSICQMAVRLEKTFIPKDYSHVDNYTSFTVSLCSFWVKLFLMNEDLPPHKFLDSLSQLKFLVGMESPKSNQQRHPYFGRYLVPDKYRSNHFPEFIERFSSSDIEPIKTLVNVSRRLLEDDKVRFFVSPEREPLSNCLSNPLIKEGARRGRSPSGNPGISVHPAELEIDYFGISGLVSQLPENECSVSSIRVVEISRVNVLRRGMKDLKEILRNLFSALRNLISLSREACLKELD